jgi:sulfane dehydrogenase subunit SoxC
MEPKQRLSLFTRRSFLAAGAASLGALATPSTDVPQELGAPRRHYGERSPFETSSRYFRDSITPGTGSSRTPLQDLYGIITPSALHFERHHAGVPQIDPRAHELLIHGLVDRPLVFTMKDLKRFPSVSHVRFIECGKARDRSAAQPWPAQLQRVDRRPT